MYCQRHGDTLFQVGPYKPQVMDYTNEYYLKTTLLERQPLNVVLIT